MFDFKKIVGMEEREVFGLDAGSSNVKAVKLSKGAGQWQLLSAATIPLDAYEDHDINSRQINSVRAMKDAAAALNADTDMAVCGLCGPAVAVRHFSFPPLGADELEGAVMLEAQQVCPFSCDDGTVDYQLLESNPEGVRGVLVAATNKLINNTTRLVADSSLKPVLVDVDGLALLNCYTELENVPQGQPVAIVNIGHWYTNVAILDSDNTPFVRDISFGGKRIIEKVAEMNNVSVQTISSLFAGDEQVQDIWDDVSASLEQAVAGLATDIRESLRFYSAQAKSKRIEQIHLCGGFSLVASLPELLGKLLSVTVNTWNPMSKLKLSEAVVGRDEICANGPLFAVAIGLAMRSV